MQRAPSFNIGLDNRDYSISYAYTFHLVYIIHSDYFVSLAITTNSLPISFSAKKL